MTELIKIRTKEGKQIVNARDLWEFLEVQTRFNDWIVRCIEDFNFKENIDFASLTQNRVNGGKTKEYHITISMAKELSMLQRTDKGKKARLYFIACEEAGQQLKLALYDDPVIKLRLDQLEMEKRIQQTEQAVKQIQGKQNQLKTDPEYFAIVGYASYIDMPIDLKIAQQLGKQAKKMCADNGFVVGSIPDPRFGKVHTYPKEVLELVFDSFSMK